MSGGKKRPKNERHVVIGVDPGREKCGVAMLVDGRVARRAIVPRERMVTTVGQWAAERAAEIVVGGGTSGAAAVEELRAAGLEVRVTDEAGSSLEARRLYWKANPPRGWRRLIPLSFLVPPVPVDDWAAVVVALRYLQGIEEKSVDG